ncbi:hypothetical protein HPB50_020695 [Hyalomma asiaticum]|uniref:Uncharacterized protein n=1 Tax=Hyalomma asiaticum TaxID=266040 RepID=A0ACB7S468_HYAAI|nr:hypothetical protein HPB50_020695 [Hyalomma asiaticum]
MENLKVRELIEICEELGLTLGRAKRKQAILEIMKKEGVTAEEVDEAWADIKGRREEAERRELREREEAERRELREREREEAERQERLEMKRIELALRQCSQAPSVASATVPVSGHRIRDQLPPFVVGEDMAKYLVKFEHVCERNAIERSLWAQNLLALLPGEVSDVITCLSREAFESYDEVKEALLRRYKLSPEAFRQRFRYAKRGNESHVDFAFRLKADLVEWLKGEDVYDDRDKVVECIALEQFYRCIEDDVKLWLQDKLGEVQLNKAAELAEEYYTRRNLHSRAVRVEKAERKEGFPRKPDERKPFPNRNLRKDPSLTKETVRDGQTEAQKLETLQMASGPWRPRATGSNHHTSEGSLQEEQFPTVADSKGFVPFFEDPFKQGLILSSRSLASLQKVSPPSVQPYPPLNRAEFLESPTSHCPSPTESDDFQSLVGGFSDVRRLSPVLSSDGDHWSQRSVSRLFSISTGCEEFDEASLSNRMSSVSEDDRHRVEPFVWSRCNKAAAFLAAAAVVCISAVMVDMTWVFLSRGNARQFPGEARGVMSTETAEGGALLQNAPMVKWPSMTNVKSSLNTTKSFEDWDTDASAYGEDGGKPTTLDMAITRLPSSAARRKHEGEKLPRSTPLRPQQRSVKRRRTLRRRNGTASRRRTDFEAWSETRSPSIPRPTNNRCGLFFYTYCSKLRHEAYYRRSTHSCVLTITDDVQVCNHSPNKFATLGECQHSCVRTRMPSVSCLEKPLFFWCGRRDVNASWWAFDGRICRPWNFPAGLCPSPTDRDVFHSRGECMRSCVAADPGRLNAGGGGRKRRCRTPGFGTTCDSSVLRFPYFAHKLPGREGRYRCIRSSAAMLFAHRCLIGSNRFLSEAECRRTCIEDVWVRA